MHTMDTTLGKWPHQGAQWNIQQYAALAHVARHRLMLDELQQLISPLERRKPAYQAKEEAYLKALDAFADAYLRREANPKAIEQLADDVRYTAYNLGVLPHIKGVTPVEGQLQRMGLPELPN